MTNFAMNDAQRELYARLVDFSFDEGGEELTFARRVARENGWTPAYAERAIEEYRRFLFLAVVAEHPVTPSDQVDQVWHLHLTYTRSYWDRMCGQVLGQAVHHGPTKGGDAEGQKFEQWYAATQASYQRFFGHEPPPDVWPAAEVRFGDDVHYQRINTRRNWVIPKPWSRPSATLLAATATPLIGGATLFADDSKVLTIFFVMAALLVVLFVIKRAVNNNRRGGGGGMGGCSCGGFFGGGDSGCGSSGCGSSCGGGCGGCGS